MKTAFPITWAKKLAYVFIDPRYNNYQSYMVSSAHSTYETERYNNMVESSDDGGLDNFMYSICS